MSLLFFTGFDNYLIAQVLNGWWTTNNNNMGGGVNTINNTGRGGGGCFACTGGSNGFANLTKTLAPGDVNATLAGAFLVPNLTAQWTVMQVMDVATAQINVVINTDGTLAVRRGATVICGPTTAPNIVAPNSFYHIGVKTKIDPSAGTVDLYLNSNNVASATGVNTRNTANTSWNGVWYGGSSTGTVSGFKMDDIYVCDGTGPAPYNAFLGDCSATIVYQTADGNYLVWTPTPSGAHWSTLDEATPNDDTDYIEGVTTGDKDSWQFTLPSGRTILAVSDEQYIKQTAAGTRTSKEFFRSGGVDYEFATADSPTTSYLSFPHIRTTNPATGLPWVAGATVEFGIKVQS